MKAASVCRRDGAKVVVSEKVGSGWPGICRVR